jgi:predicted transcriptional regulator of viral defense system
MATKRLKDNELSREPSVKAVLSKLSRKAVGGVVTVHEAASLLGLERRAASARLAALARRGWLTRVRRGFYYVLPLESGNEPAVAPDPWVLAFRLFEPCYIGGWSAAEHWGLTEQLFRSTFVVTSANIRERSQTFLRAEFHLVRVRQERLLKNSTVWRGDVRVPIADRERTIADALVDPTWIGGIRHLIDILHSYVTEPKKDFPKIIHTLDHIGHASGIKRLGFLAETLFPEESWLIEAAHARRSTGVIRLDPSIKSKGRLSKRWGLWINVSIPLHNNT